MLTLFSSAAGFSFPRVVAGFKIGQIEVAQLLFGIALIASGQSSTLCGTLAGQYVMEGFLEIRAPPVLRRLITRLLAVVPAVLVIIAMGDEGTYQLLILSQVWRSQSSLVTKHPRRDRAGLYPSFQEKILIHYPPLWFLFFLTLILRLFCRCNYHSRSSL